MANRIENYFNDINNLFSVIRSNYDINFSSNPVSKGLTIATFGGSYKDYNYNIMLEISCNHKELESKDQLFVYTYFGSRGNSAGIININDLQEAAELIYAALRELGFKTDEDREREKEEKEIKNRERLEKEKKDRAEAKKKIDDYLSKNDEKEEPVEDNSINDEETDETIKVADEEFDLYKEKLDELGEKDNCITASISYGEDFSKMSVISVDVFYVDSNTCRVKTEGISPKIDKETTWDKAKNMMLKVTKKLNGVISLYAITPDGHTIKLKPDEEEDGFNALDGVRIDGLDI